MLVDLYEIYAGKEMMQIDGQAEFPQSKGPE